MFILYALPVGLLTGWLSGGRLQGLTDVRLRWAPLALLGFLIQLVLFFGPVAESVGALGMPIYVGSTALVLTAVLRNGRLPGLPLVALGAISNMAAIVANGGYMPASAGAMEALGRAANDGYSNSAVMDQPALAPLTDIFAIPAGVPFANVFSVGDVLIGVGIAWAIAAAMRGGARRNLPPKYGLASTDEQWPGTPPGPTVPVMATTAIRQSTVQGKPAARRGRKARDLATPKGQRGRPVAGTDDVSVLR